ncbi:MAG: MarR family transcriptional regulator [Hyphomicrobiaceae bacterium]
MAPVDVASDADVGTREPAEAPSSGDLVKFVELLFFAYRDFTGDADELLADLGYGRAHHRVIHFVGRHPGLRVADLLDILRITKQSLARVLKQLIDEGFVTQRSGETDRRERHLFLTQKGQNFAEKLTKLQCARVGNALETVGPVGRDLVEDFLVAMISDHDQAAVSALFEKATKHEHEQRAGSGDIE